ncbi:hypothetical protein HK105_204875 [Polyrhizophydium stewartii]|uniref:CDC20/Fizzy WD40 domain-containing protein n=1 Tax=Polyrhizophydium stewartii TaxID=2732419 RepID=A0ABR4N860_9FUNG
MRPGSSTPEPQQSDFEDRGQQPDEGEDSDGAFETPATPSRPSKRRATSLLEEAPTPTTTTSDRFISELSTSGRMQFRLSVSQERREQQQQQRRRGVHGQPGQLQRPAATLPAAALGTPTGRRLFVASTSQSTPQSGRGTAAAGTSAEPPARDALAYPTPSSSVSPSQRASKRVRLLSSAELTQLSATSFNNMLKRAIGVPPTLEPIHQFTGSATAPSGTASRWLAESERAAGANPPAPMRLLAAPAATPPGGDDNEATREDLGRPRSEPPSRTGARTSRASRDADDLRRIMTTPTKRDAFPFLQHTPTSRRSGAGPSSGAGSDAGRSLIGSEMDLLDSRSLLMSPSARRNTLMQRLQLFQSLQMQQETPHGHGARRSPQALGGLLTRHGRRLPDSPETVLDAPDVRDDYYINVLDWGMLGFLMVALNDKCYLWSQRGGVVSEIYQTPADDYITCCAFSPQGHRAMVATEAGDMLLFDVRRTTLGAIKSAASDQGIAALRWVDTSVFATGNRHGTVGLWDTRLQGFGSIASATGFHRDRVVGIAVHRDEMHFATGGNGHIVNIWDRRQMARPLLAIHEHTSAVRALQWCPWEDNLLATGGGLGDGKICFFNSNTGRLQATIETGQQVCQVLWSRYHRELVSLLSLETDQIVLWRYPTLEQIGSIPGHTGARPLFAALSPDGQTLATMAGDETIKASAHERVCDEPLSWRRLTRCLPEQLWKCFPTLPGQLPLKPRLSALETPTKIGTIR